MSPSIDTAISFFLGPKKNKGLQATGRGRKGLGTAIHMAISFEGVLNFKLFPAQRQDKRSFFEVCEDWSWDRIIYLLPGSTKTIEDCYDVKNYRKKHAIERLFGLTHENKRIAMRFDKLDSTFFSFISLALMKAYHLFC